MPIERLTICEWSGATVSETIIEQPRWGRLDGEQGVSYSSRPLQGNPTGDSVTWVTI
jgi:hypothetical protein